MFIENFANSSAVLSPATAKATPDPIQWTQLMLEAFSKLKCSLCKNVVLCVPCPSDIFVLCTDASARGVGGVLCVQRKEKELPVAFYSRQLRGPECRYSAIELEALAVVVTVGHFAHYLWGRRFKILTDHHALEPLMTSRVLNRRLQIWALQLQDFNFQIEY